MPRKRAFRPTDWVRYQRKQRFAEDLDRIISLIGSMLYEAKFKDGWWWIRRLE